MANAIKALIIFSGMAFVLAVIETVFTLTIIGITAEGFSRACTNLALIAIALSVCLKGEVEGQEQTKGKESSYRRESFDEGAKYRHWRAPSRF